MERFIGISPYLINRREELGRTSDKSLLVLSAESPFAKTTQIPHLLVSHLGVLGGKWREKHLQEPTESTWLERTQRHLEGEGSVKDMYSFFYERDLEEANTRNICLSPV